MRLRKIVGTAFLVLFVPFYALAVVALSSGRMADQSTLVQVSFFAFFGLAWILPAGLVIWWMNPRQKTARR